MKRHVCSLALFLMACGARPPHPAAPQPASYPGYLAPSDTLSPPFVVQQTLHGRYGERELSIDVVLQLAQGKLIIIGLTPFGSRAFVLEQVGSELHFQKLIDREMPFDPKSILNDVHRVFFRKLTDKGADGVITREDHGEKVSERWQHGVLLERRFERVDGQPKGVIVITFDGAPSPVIAPKVRIQNGWFGYTLNIDNGAQQILQ